jgi:hypothetical protein
MSRLLLYFKEICLLLLLFVYIYNPPFKGLPVYPGFFISLVSFFILVAYLLVNKRTIYTVKNVSPFILILFLIIYSYFIVFLHGTGETFIAKGYFLYIIAYLVGPNLILIVLKKRNQLNLVDVVNYIIWLAVIQSVIMLGMLAMPSFKSFIFNIQNSDRQFLHLESGGFRMLGLAYGVVWDLGIVQSLSSIFIVWLIPKTKSARKIWLLAIAYLLIFASILMSGRTGFVGILLSILLLFYNLLSGGSLMMYRKFISRILITLIIVLNLIYASLSPDIRDLITEKVLPWAFEMFINSQEGSGVETQSTNQLKDMYFDISNSTFLMGDGYYRDPNDSAAYYMGTDAGYMRQILFYGIFGSLILYSFYFFIFKNMLLKSLKMYDNSTAVMIFLIAFYFFFAHVKGDVFMGGDMPLRILFLLYFVVLNTTKPIFNELQQ